MSLRQTLAHRLRETWNGNPWYGDSSARILEGVTAAEAARRIAPGTHSIHEIVLHMTAWTEAVAARVRGQGARAPERGDWPSVGDTTPAAWTASLAGLEEARRDLLRAIEETHEEDLHIHVRNYAPPFADTGISRAGTVAGLADHDTYHLGQIALLKRAIRANPTA
jgi:uncharacterized damage-inducible protein DinB